MKRALALIAASLFLMAAAPDPADMLTDKAQEARARAIFKQTRCVVCQNESIDDSEAPLARDVRQIIRGQIQAGRTDGQVKAFLVDKYGDFISLRPPFDFRDALLWLGPFAVVVGGIAVILSRRKSVAVEDELTDEEAKRLTQLQNNSPPGSVS
jgi:cytochrome c-type biogenesis protein CcmH